MTTRAEQLARQFEMANDELIALIERLDERQWRFVCAEGWTVAQAACHIADDHAVLAGFVRLIAGGGPLPDFDAEAVHQLNAEQSARNADCTTEHVLQLLRSNGAGAAAMIRGFEDTHLDAAVSVPASHAFRVMDNLPERLTASLAIEAGLIGHFKEHGWSILSAAYPALAAGRDSYEAESSRSSPIPA
jgi:hypothetical protein